MDAGPSGPAAVAEEQARSSDITTSLREKDMSIAETLLPEFDHEMANTRRMLEVVPAADADWRPHPKSYSLGDLAAHIARLPLWGRMTLEQPELDLGLPANAALARPRFT